MFISNEWQDYELIDVADGKRLERWGKNLFVRPDPMAIWKEKATDWKGVCATYHRSDKGGGKWEFHVKLSQEFNIKYRNLTFKCKPMGFKHMGVFPEQATNWDWVRDIIQKANRPLKILNLFAYTGAATISAAEAGASVCHVDAAKGMVQMAKENSVLSNLEAHNIRYIVDDCAKFVSRETRRKNYYDGIILDPPSYGRGPNGEIWKIEDNLSNFLDLCAEVLSNKPAFVLLNSYSTGISAGIIEALLKTKFGKNVVSRETGLPVTSREIVMPSGVSGRWIA